MFLLRAAARRGEFFEIVFRVLSAGGDFVRAFAVEATRDATGWIDALDGRVVWKDAVALGALVIIILDRADHHSLKQFMISKTFDHC